MPGHLSVRASRKGLKMKIKYKCFDKRASNGHSETVAAFPSLALVYWLMIHAPDGANEAPGPHNKQLLTLVHAAIEREWGISTDLEVVDPPVISDDWKFIHNLYQERDGRVTPYEDACLELLWWLREHGDIIELHILEIPEGCPDFSS